jgi:curved DNA-binding protein CbpA
MSDHYTALGLASSATLDEIKLAYRKKAAFYHPDRNDAEDAADRFRAVQDAYDVLSDTDKRQAFDDNRRRNLLDNPLETAQGIWHNYIKNIVL